MNLRILLFLLGILCSGYTNANNSDSLHRVLLLHAAPTLDRAHLLTELAQLFGRLQRDSAIHYYREALDISRQVKDQPIQLLCHERLARLLLNQSLRLDSVDLHLDSAFRLLGALPNTILTEASLLRTRGEYFRQKGELEIGLTYLDTASTVIKKGLEGALSEKDQVLYHDKYILILNAKGNNLKNQGKCEEALLVQGQIMELSKQTDNYDQMGYASFNRGSCYFILGDFPQALDNYLKSPTYTKNPAIRKNMQAGVNLAAGAVYAEMGQLDSAKVYYLKALQMGTNNQRARTRIGTLENLGALEMKAERYDSAIYYFQQGIELARTSDRKGMLAASLTQLGAAHLYSGHRETAYRYLSEANSLSQALRGSSEIAYLKAALAEYYLETGNTQLAIQYGKEALVDPKNRQMSDISRRTTLTLSKAYEAQGASSQALVYFQQHVALKDSMRNEDKVREITQVKMQSRFEQEQERQRLEQEQKDALVAEQLRRQDIQRKALGGGILGLALLAGLLFWGFRTKQKSNVLLANKNEIIQASLAEKEVLLKEIHHRVKNNLQVISSLLSLQSQQVQDQSVQDAILEGRNRVKSMAMIHQNLYQTENLRTIDVADYINKLTRNLFDSYNIEPERIQMDANIQSLQLDVDILIPLGLILNELITNALKYAFPESRVGKIQVSLQTENEELKLRVADNGVGLPNGFDTRQTGSMGFQLINAFVAKLKGKLDVKNSSGADISLSIPQQLAV